MGRARFAARNACKSPYLVNGIYLMAMVNLKCRLPIVKIRGKGQLMLKIFYI